MTDKKLTRRAALTAAGTAAVALAAAPTVAEAKGYQVPDNLLIEGAGWIDEAVNASAEDKAYKSTRAIGWLAALGLMLVKDKNPAEMTATLEAMMSGLDPYQEPTGGWLHHFDYGFRTGVSSANYQNS